MKKLGRNLGVIFQIQDDILELESDSENMGKGTFSDIERNKKTILTCLAMEKNLNEWKKLIETTNHENVSSKKESIYNFFIENKLRQEADKLLEDCISQCNDIINELPEEIQGGLNELINYIIKRNR